MNHQKILRRAWDILWRYRVLWIFGFLLALTSGGGASSAGGGGNGGGGNGSRAEVPLPDALQRELGQAFQWFATGLPAEYVPVWITIALSIVCLVVLLIIVSIVVRYVAETALIRMVDAYEETDEQYGLRRGFRLGWSRAAWRLFLIDLVIWVPAVVVFLVVLLVTLAPLLAWTTNNTTLGILGTAMTVGLVLLAVFLFIVASIVLTLLTLMSRRVCALENQGVLTSIGAGYTLVRSHLIDVLVMGIIIFAVNVVAAVLLIPIAIPIILLAGVFGGVPALVTGALAGALIEGAFPWILAAIVGIPLFILAIVVPLTFLSGLVEVYKSTTWTLTYRELRALEPATQ